MKEKEFNKKLLVEGNDDLHVIMALCKKHEVDHTFNIIDCKGIDQLEKSIPVQLKGSDIDTVGIIIDADTDLNTRWNKIKIILSENSFDIPDLLPATGVISKNADGDKTVGVWIMPDNNTAGMLEDFIKALIPEGDDLYSVVDVHLDGIEEKGICRYKSIHKSKAFVCSWLALQDEPGVPMGRSITMDYLSTESTACNDLIGWLKTLFQ